MPSSCLVALGQPGVGGRRYYADAEIRPILQSAPALDRPASRALVARLYPQHQLTEIADGRLFEQANPDDDRIYAGCFPGLTVVCTGDAALDQPSQLDQRFLREARGRRLYLHAMHSVDWDCPGQAEVDGLNRKLAGAYREWMTPFVEAGKIRDADAGDQRGGDRAGARDRTTVAGRAGRGAAAHLHRSAR